MLVIAIPWQAVARHALLLLALSACSSRDYLTLPEPDASVHTVLIATLADELAVRAYDVALAPSQIDLPGDVRLVVVLHAEATLAELYLQPGELGIAEAGQCASVPVPEWSTAFALKGDALEPVSDVGLLADVRFAVPCPCVSFEATAFAVPAAESVRSILPYDGDRALVVSSAGFVFVHRDASTQITEPPQPMWASFRDQQGTFWFGDIGGQLWFGDPLGQLRRTFTSSAVRDVVSIAGYVEPDRFELLTASKDRLLQRFDGQRWDVLFRQNDLSDDQRGDIVFFRPGRAVAMLPDGDGLLEYDDMRITEVELEDWAPAERGHLATLQVIEPLGTFLGTRTGRVYRRPSEDGPLELLEDPVPPEDRSAIFDIEPFRGGFIEVGSRGLVRQWHPTSGYCDGISIDLANDLQRIAPLGDVFVTGGNVLDRDNNKGYVVRVVQP